MEHLTLLTDLYELTMMKGYFKTGNHDTVVFDAFYRTNPSNGGYPGGHGGFPTGTAD